MQRDIYTVNAMQVNVSSANPQGVYQAVPDYPKRFDSREYGINEENPNGNPELALDAANAEYYETKRKLGVADAPSRVRYTITLARSDGQTLQKFTRGAFPDMTPTPEPEPQEEPTEA